MKKRSRLISALFVCSVTGCSDTTPAQIAVQSDTLIVNTTTVEPLDVQVLNRKGAVVRGVPIEYSTTESDSTLVVRDGSRIQCRGDGTTRVTLTAGKLATSAIVRCDIIEKIVAEGLVCTRLGDPPLHLSIAAFDRDGNAIANPRLYVLTDSSFVRIANGLITPLRAGDGDIDYTTGRRRAVTLLRVLERTGTLDSSSSIAARNKMFESVCAAL